MVIYISKFQSVFINLLFEVNNPLSLNLVSLSCSLCPRGSSISSLVPQKAMSMMVKHGINRIKTIMMYFKMSGTNMSPNELKVS